MKKLSLLKLALSMTIFGTIGIFIKLIPAERGFIAMLRGIVGGAVLLSFMLLIRHRPSIASLKRNLWLLVASGAAIGANWIFLFESYSYTTVAVSTLCYYMAPVFVILFSPFVTGERIDRRRVISVVLSLLGMVLVSGVLESDEFSLNTLIGVALALCAAGLYASVTLMNKRMKDIDSMDMTVCQLLVAGAVILPYTLIAEDNSAFAFDLKLILPLIIVCVLHTGFAYLLYFSSIKELSAQTVAVFSYLDPIVAIISSVVFLHERMTLLSLIGAVLILASTLYSSIERKRVFKND